MKYLLFLLPCSLLAQTPEPCTGGDCYCIYESAMQVWKAKQYEMAIYKLNAWKTCAPDSVKTADSLVIEVFREIEKLKTDAEQATRTAYANDLAYKSEIALKDGDRNAAFRLADFAHRYVDSTNTNVLRALVEALYYNDNPKHSPLPRVTNLEGHTYSVYSVAFSPDGKRLATGSDDKSAKIWDLDSGKALTTLEGHTSAVWSVAFSPDGKRLATGSLDKSAKIWDLDSGKALTTLEGHTKSVQSVAFSPDGKRLATGSADNSAKIWDLDSGKALTTLEGHTNSVTSVAFSPDGKRLATGSADNSAKIWILQPDTLIQHWQRKKQVGLLLPQLQQYNLQTLLDQHSDNEAKLIATKEVWQITHFADLYANQAQGSNILTRVEPLYARADRLYAAALRLQEEAYIRQNYQAMLENWAKVYRENGMQEKAAEVEGKGKGGNR